MNVRQIILPAILGMLGLALLDCPPAGGQTWDGPKLAPVPRQEVFEFTQPPTFKQAVDEAGQPIKDRYEIAFASKGYCDVAVAIHDARGELIRHVVYGVLGPNAPTGLQANSLSQKVIWDGKDDYGKYVADPASCQARVSLGLKGTFDKVIGWHPKDTSAPSMITGLGAGPAGVFVASFTGSYWRSLRVFNHDGSYQRTLIPFAADKWPTVQAHGGIVAQPIPGEPDAPARCGHGRYYPSDPTIAEGVKLVETNGCVIWGVGAYGVKSAICRIKVDGSADTPILGPPITSERETGEMAGIYAMAASPDGRWVYLTRLIAGQAGSEDDGPSINLRTHVVTNTPNRRHAVFRLAWQGGKPVGTESFVGEVTPGNTNKGADSDNGHFNSPEDVATDSGGRVYVADGGNHRVQVFSPEAKYLATIPVDAPPHKVGVHHKTGQVYVMSYPWSPANRAWLYKFSAMPDCQLLAKTEVRLPDYDYGRMERYWPDYSAAGFALDSWAEPVQVWIAVGLQITRWADRGDRFELVENFDETIRRDGFTPHALAQGGKMAGKRVSADRIRGHLYYAGNAYRVLRCDPEVGKAWESIRLPLSPDDFQVGYDGYFYVRDQRAVARLDPTVLTRSGEEPMLTGEVPFDYGEELTDGYDGIRVFGPGQRLKGVVRVPALIPGNGFNMGFGVNHLGHFAALCMNYHQAIAPDDPRYRSIGSWLAPPSDRYRPAMFPGRLWSQAQVVFAYDDKGKQIGEDVVKSLSKRASGVKMDRQDNVYVGLAAFPIVDGKPVVSAAEDGGNGPGAVLKFPLSGGKVYGEWGEPVKLDKLPDRPAEFFAGYGHEALAGTGAKLWTQNMLWRYPGLSTQRNCGGCICPRAAFDVDVYGRVFVPESYRFSVGVCDTNGNPVLHIGRYGNADSGRGPDSPVPVEGGIAFSSSDYVCTVSDKWLYVSDTGNWRVVRIRLGYHAERTSGLQ